MLTPIFKLVGRKVDAPAVVPKPSAVSLAELPSDIHQCIGDFLPLADFCRLASTSKAMRAQVLALPHHGVSPLNGSRRLQPRIAHLADAHRNMADGVIKRQQWTITHPGKTEADNLHIVLNCSKQGSLAQSIITHPASVDLFSPGDIVARELLGLPAEAFILDLIPLTADRSGYAILATQDLGPKIWHTEQGRPPISYPLPDNYLDHPRMRGLSRLGATGLTAIMDDERTFLRLKSAESPYQNAIGRGEFPNCEPRPERCPATGRTAIFQGSNILCYNLERSSHTQVAVDIDPTAFNRANFSPDGKGLIVSGVGQNTAELGAEAPAQGWNYLMFSVSGETDEAPNLVLRKTFTTRHGLAPTWFLSRDGAWNVRLSEMYPRSRRLMAEFDLENRNCHVLTLAASEPTGPLSAAQQALQDTYNTGRYSDGKAINALGHDEEGNAYHLLDDDNDSTCWLYRVKTQSGIIARTQFNNALAREIQSEKTGKILWAQDGASLMFRNAQGYRHLNFGLDPLRSEMLAPTYSISPRLAAKTLSGWSKEAMENNRPLGLLVCATALGAFGIALYTGRSSQTMAVLLSLGIFLTASMAATLSAAEDLSKKSAKPKPDDSSLDTITPERQ